jgi:hypothetical protein
MRASTLPRAVRTADANHMRTRAKSAVASPSVWLVARSSSLWPRSRSRYRILLKPGRLTAEEFDRRDPGPERQPVRCRRRRGVPRRGGRAGGRRQRAAGALSRGSQRRSARRPAASAGRCGRVVARPAVPRQVGKAARPPSALFGSRGPGLWGEFARRAGERVARASPFNVGARPLLEQVGALQCHGACARARTFDHRPPATARGCSRRTMKATDSKIASAPARIALVTASDNSAQPRNTATTGLT